MKPPQPQASLGKAPAVPSVAQGRLCIILAAVLWSTNGVFKVILTQDTPLGLNVPPLSFWHIACFRVLCAGIVLLPFLRRSDFTFRPMMAVTAICFALMNLTFIAALTLGTTANAVLLQYTAPMWVYLIGVWLLGEPADKRGGAAVAIGVCGICIIAFGGWQGGQLGVVAFALASGVAFAGVILGLHLLNNASPRLVTAVNLLFSGLVLVPALWGEQPPTAAQLGALMVYGAVQLALPYWLMARGLRSVNSPEAGTLTLLEPVLTPCWAYLMSPETEAPTVFTLIGGGFIMGALAYRYWPRRQENQSRTG